MEFEQLPSLWQKDAGEGAVPEALLSSVVDRSRQLARDVRRRDLVESGLALVMVPFFGACVFLGAHPVARIGAAILTLSCLLIPLRLRAARRCFEPAPREGSLRAFLLAERERVRAQAQLLRSVLWWYLLPLGLGVVLLFGGGTRSFALSLGYAGLVIAFYGWIYRLNQNAVSRELDPRRDQLETLLAALDRDDVPVPGLAD
jgi:hypothetical protein